MKRSHIAAKAALAAWISLGAIPASEAAEERLKTELVRINDEPRYNGMPLSYWLEIIRRRDEAMLSNAFGAVRSLGPQARAAVPDLMRIVSTPYVPIRLGRDSDAAVLGKLLDIEIRSEAIDALASIGPAASPATEAVIQWALTVRVVSEDRFGVKDDRFMDLVALDAEYRLRTIEAIGAFGEPALPTVARLLESSNDEKRKLAIAILGLDAVGVAAELLKSGDCSDGRLAIRILDDMQPIVAKAYINVLRNSLVCDAN